MRHLCSSLLVVATLSVVGCADDDYSSRPPKIYFAADGSYSIEPTDTITLSPRVLYDFGSSYEWTLDGQVVSHKQTLDFCSAEMKDYTLTFCVSNSNGADTASINVRVAHTIDSSDFDNCNNLKSNTLRMSPDTLPGAFVWHDFTFWNVVNADTTMWAGFAQSSRTTLQSSINSDAIGTAYISSGQTATDYYMVAYALEDMAQIHFGGYDQTPISIDIANDNFVYLASKFGYLNQDSVMVSPVSRDDYFRVVIDGADEFGLPTGGRQTFDLINCSFDNPAKYVRHSDWTTIDLRPIGRVPALRFSVETNRTDYPPLFCIDNLILQD